MTAPGFDKPLRSDAERNRQRILAAAATVFAERGLAASLDDIATAAGVGVGTVYRRFPDKDALIDALFEEKIAKILALAHEGLEQPDPWDGLSGFMRGVCRLQAEDQGLKEALLQVDRGKKLAVTRNTIAPVAGELLKRAQDAGVVRADLDTHDIPIMHFSVGFVADRTREDSPRYWERVLTIFLDGIRVRRDQPTPMPAPPLDRDQFIGAMSLRHSRGG
jgi:AcrR family transcriptional regulator